EEGVFLEQSADEDHRMGAHDVDDDASAKLGEIIRSYHRVLVPRQKIVEPRLVFDEIVDTGPVFQSPFHMSDEAGQREAPPAAAFEYLLNQRQHPFLIEMTVAQVRVGPIAQLEAAASFCRRRVDTRLCQPSD